MEYKFNINYIANENKYSEEELNELYFLIISMLIDDVNKRKNG